MFYFPKASSTASLERVLSSSRLNIVQQYLFDILQYSAPLETSFRGKLSVSAVEFVPSTLTIQPKVLDCYSSKDRCSFPWSWKACSFDLSAFRDNENQARPGGHHTENPTATNDHGRKSAAFAEIYKISGL